MFIAWVARPFLGHTGSRRLNFRANHQRLPHLGACLAERLAEVLDPLRDRLGVLRVGRCEKDVKSISAFGRDEIGSAQFLAETPEQYAAGAIGAAGYRDADDSDERIPAPSPPFLPILDDAEVGDVRQTGCDISERPSKERIHAAKSSPY